jgi:hypothetical protein
VTNLERNWITKGKHALTRKASRANQKHERHRSKAGKLKQLQALLKGLA